MTGVGEFPKLTCPAGPVVAGVNSSAPRPSFDTVMTPPQIAQRARTIGP